MKKIISSLVLFTFIMFLFPSTAFASTQGSLNYYDYNSLTVEQQSQLIKESPTISQDFNEYNLVYRQVTSTSPGTDGFDNMFLITVCLLGLSAVLIGIFLLRKHKKTGRFLFMLIVPALIVGPMAYGYAAEKISPSESINITETSVSMTPKVISGYEYIGYYTDSIVKGTVKVMYVDGDDKQLFPTATLKGSIGSTYSAKEESIDGYVLDTIEGSVTGSFAKEYQTVKFVYTDKMKINIQYLDSQTGLPLVLDFLHPYYSSLVAKYPDIENYTFTREDNVTNYPQDAVISSEQVIQKIGTSYSFPTEIKFLITTRSGEIKEYLIHNPLPGSSYNTIWGYYTESVTSNHQGIADKKEITVTYIIYAKQTHETYPED